MTTHPRGLARLIEERRAQTHCKRGHEFTPQNTYERPPGNGRRQCRECERARIRRRRAQAHQPRPVTDDEWWHWQHPRCLGCGTMRRPYHSNGRCTDCVRGTA